MHAQFNRFSKVFVSMSIIFCLGFRPECAGAYKELSFMMQPEPGIFSPWGYI